MSEMKKYLKKNYKIIIILICIAFIFLMPMPYYIDAPGGLTNLNNKINIDGKKINGSYNMTYVLEYKGNIPMLIYAYFNKNYDIYKKEDILLDKETDAEYNTRDKLYLEESLSNSVIAGYNAALKKVTIKNKYLYVGYKLEDSNTDLKIGDSISKVDGNVINTKKEFKNLLNKRNVGAKISIEVINNGKTYKRNATIIEKNGENIIGIIPIEVIDYETSPEINFTMDKNESGSSGGLMLSLTIYDLLVNDDLAKGRTIAGTGTIDESGNVGAIGGVKYKIKGAVKNKADIFFVPIDNYEEAKKVVKDNNYKLNLVKVSTLKEAINYLK